MPQLIDQLFIELGTRLEGGDMGAGQVEGVSGRIGAAMQKAEDAVTEYVDELLKTPEGAAAAQQALERLQPPLGIVAAGMTKAASGSEIFEQGLRRLQQQEAEAALQAQVLARPVSDVAARMGFAATGAGQWAAGLRNLQIQQAEQTTATGAQTGAITLSHGALSKAKAGLVGFALATTGASQSTGQLVSALLLMSGGTGALLGVAAGIAILAAAYSKLTEAQRKTREEALAVVKAMREAAETPVSKLEADLKRIDQQLADLERRRKEAATPGPAAGRFGVVQPGQTTPSTEQQDQVNALLIARNRTRVALDEASRQAGQILTDLEDTRRRLLDSLAARIKFTLPTEEVRQQLADLNREIAAVSAAKPDDQARVKETFEADLSVRRSALAQIRQDLATTFTTTLPVTIDATVQAITQLAAKLTEAEAPPAEVEKAIKPLIDRLKELKAAADQLQLDQALSLGPQQALDRLDELRAAVTAQLQSAQQRFATKPGEVDETDAAFAKRLQETEQSAETLRLRERIKEIDADRTVILAQLVALDQQNVAASEQVLTSEQKQAPVLRGIAALKHELAQVDTSTTAGQAQYLQIQQAIRAEIARQAREVEQVARAAVQAAEAFGGMDQASAAVLENVIQVGTAVGSVVAQLQNNLSISTGDLLGIAGGLAGIASSIFGGGESEQSKRARETAEQNTLAIRKLTDRIGDLNLDITGTQFTGAQRAVTTLSGLSPNGDTIRRLTTGGKEGFFKDLGDEISKTRLDAKLRTIGSSLEDLQKVADEVGIKLNFDGPAQFLASLAQLNKALAETELARFADTLSGRLDALDAEATFFGLTAQQQLEALAKELGGTHANPITGATTLDKNAVPAIAQALKGLDLTIAKDRDEFKRRLGELIKALETPGGLTPGQLGGLTPEEFLAEILKLGGFIDQASQDAGDQGATSNFVQENRITETTGQRLAGLEESQLTVQKEIAATALQIADNTAPLLAALRAALSVAGATVPVPAIPALRSTTSPGPGAINLTVNVPGMQLTAQFLTPTNQPASAAADVTGLIADQIADQLERKLAEAINRRMALRGQTLQ